MKNGIFKLDWATIADAVLTAAVGAVVAGFVTLVTTAGFDVFTADWNTIYHSAVNWAFVAGVVSLGKDFLSTNAGSLLGMGPTSQG